MTIKGAVGLAKIVINCIVIITDVSDRSEPSFLFNHNR